MNELWNTEGLTPAEQAAYLANVKATMIAAWEVLGANLEAAMAVAVSTDLEGTAKLMGIPPAAVVRMATDPHMPDMVLLRKGLKIARRRNIPMRLADVISKINTAWHINGASDREINRVAELLIQVADMIPLDGEVWAGASADDKIIFQQAVKYARTLWGARLGRGRRTARRTLGE